MPITKLSTILSWFETGDKPTEKQFRDTWNSFWHKDEKIPVSQILDLDISKIQSKLEKGAANGYASLDELGKVTQGQLPEAIKSTGLEALDEGNGIGWRLIGKDPNTHGDIGRNAVDFSGVGEESEGGATGEYSLAFGGNSKAFGDYSIGGGLNASAFGKYSLAIGHNALATKEYGFAMGKNTKSLNICAHAEGADTVSSGVASHAEGKDTNANGDFSHAGGKSNYANSYAETSIGSYGSIVGGVDSSNLIETDRIFNIGIGTAEDDRKDAITILKDGRIIAPSLEIPNINSDKSLVTKEYLESKETASTNESSFFGSKQVLEVAIDAADLNFDGSEASNIVIIPEQVGKIIIIHDYFVAYDIKTSVEQGYAGVYLGYDLIASGYPEDVLQIPVDQIRRGFKSSTGNVLNSDFFNVDESPINAPLVLRGENGIGMSGISGNVEIKVSYSYVDFPY